jgi:predicted membrane-bound spermidine synthase
MKSHRSLIIKILLFNLGMVAMATQVIMIREALAIFHGNELVIGLFLGIWMLLTAGGAFIAILSSKFKVQSSGRSFISPTFNRQSTIDNRQSTINTESPPPRFPATLLILLAFLPMSTLFLLVILRFTFVPAGIMPGLGLTALVILLALMPFCIVSGMLFPILVQQLSSLKEKNLLHEGYALDSAGSILGGLLFSMVFIFALPPYESLVTLTLFCLFVFMILAWIGRRKALALSILLIGILITFINSRFEPASFLDKLQFNKQEVVEIKSSPYGMIAVTRIGKNFFLFENGNQVSLGDDPVNREESVHYAMLLHPLPQKVLLISGGASGSIDEILKYPVSGIDYLEPDPWLTMVARRYKPFPQDPRVNYIFKDPRIFLNNNDEKYDVILVNTPEPNSAALNRFYTVEFYNLLKSRMNPGGIISVSTLPAGNYMSETSRHIHSVNFNTLKSVFSDVRIIPGAKDYFLASDSTIEKSIFKDFQSKGIENDYVNPFYINENLLKMRSDLIMKDILPDARINSDLKPYVFSLFLRQWLERFKTNAWIIPLILILSLIISMIFLGPLNLGLFTGGFTASSLEFLLLIWLQVIYGYVYLLTGVVFAIFMAGLVVGSLLLVNRIKKHTFKRFLIIQGIFAIFSALVALLIFLISPSHLPPFPSPPLPLILFLVFITGLLMGAQFSSSARLRTSSIIKSSGESFSADLLGSAIGIVLVSVYIIPQFGLPLTALVLAGLNVLALAVMAVRRRSFGGH